MTYYSVKELEKRISEIKKKLNQPMTKGSYSDFIAQQRSDIEMLHYYEKLYRQKTQGKLFL